jgi:hypothetical protein
MCTECDVYSTFFVTLMRSVLRSDRYLSNDAIFTLEMCKDTHESTHVSVPSHSSVCRYN